MSTCFIYLGTLPRSVPKVTYLVPAVGVACCIVRFGTSYAAHSPSVWIRCATFTAVVVAALAASHGGDLVHKAQGLAAVVIALELLL